MSAFSAVARAEMERLAAECGELSALAELITGEVRAANLRAANAEQECDAAKAVAAGILSCSQLQVATALELADHVEMMLHDVRTRQLIANVRQSMGAPSRVPTTTTLGNLVVAAE